MVLTVIFVWLLNGFFGICRVMQITGFYQMLPILALQTCGVQNVSSSLIWLSFSFCYPFLALIFVSMNLQIPNSRAQLLSNGMTLVRFMTTMQWLVSTQLVPKLRPQVQQKCLQLLIILQGDEWDLPISLITYAREWCQLF